jgi:transcriptional regulator with XRE-family HTH domain
VRESLDSRFARFIRLKRGESTFAAFARRLGVTPSTLFRLENQQQSITLKSLESILKKLRCSLTDVFKD